MAADDPIKQKNQFSFMGLSLITFLLLGLANLSLRHLAQTGETGAGGTRFLWVIVDLVRLLRLAALGVFVFALLRGIVRKCR